jgi:hypothetical protein
MTSLFDIRRIATGGLACAAALLAAACCPTTAGPTAPSATFTTSLGPGEFRFIDADTPSSTTQIDLTFRIEQVDAPIHLRQIDPNCLPAAGDSCQTFYESTLTARPAGVQQFGNALQPHGARTRIVVRNPSDERTITISVTVQPHRAGCT